MLASLYIRIQMICLTSYSTLVTCVLEENSGRDGVSLSGLAYKVVASTVQRSRGIR